MKAFFPGLPTFLLCLCASPLTAAAETVISGPWTQLRQAPLFEAELQPMAKNWGPALPMGQPFQVEKVYGRWLYGVPAPLARMPKKEYLKPGWIFSRMLLLPGDQDTLPRSLAKQSQAVIFHYRAAAKELGLSSTLALDFLEGLTLSQGTLRAFQQTDERGAGGAVWPSFFPQAWAEEEKDAPLGLSGTDLPFLDQELSALNTKRVAAEKKRQALILKPPSIPPLDSEVKEAILGRYLIQKYLELPPLTHEELDGYIYMRATAMRALQGCADTVQKNWKNRRWNFFRAFRLKSRPELSHPWMEVSLPGGYFVTSGKAIDVAGNEAELAFLLVRSLVRDRVVKKKKITFTAKNWPGQLSTLSEEVWDQALKSQSTKDSENLDVADEIAVDQLATDCISRAGYRPMAGLSYLRKLAAAKELPWAKWFTEHSIGLDYRIERLAAYVDAPKPGVTPGTTTNAKRFATANRHWNLLP